MKKRAFIILAAVLSINSIFAQQQLVTENVKDSIISLMKEKHIPGVFISVVTKDTILLQEGLGIANVKTENPVTTETLFKIGSVSKTFTALAIMKLVEDGTLSLEDNLKDVAPEIPFANKWSNTNPVKIKHLLEHKAGFDDMPISVIAKDRSQDMTAFDEVMLHKKALQSRWKPGLGHAYSNPGYVILGYLIEKLTKTPYQKYMNTQVLKSLRMNGTDFRSELPTTLNAPAYAQGYRYTNNINKTKDAKIVGEAAGALSSNATDMSHFLQFLLSKQLQDSLKVVATATLLEMEALHGDLETMNAIDKGYGLGIYSRSFGTAEVPFYGHSGGIHGFSSDYIYNRALNIGFAISNNGEKSNRDLLDYLVDAFITEFYPPTLTTSIDISQFKDWSGTYVVQTKRNQIFDFIQYPVESAQIEIAKDSVYVTKFMGDKVGYSHKKNVAFAKRNNPNTSLFLVESNDTKLVHYNGDLLVPVNNIFLIILRIVLVLSLVIGVVVTLTFSISVIISIFKKNARDFAKKMLVLAAPFLLFFTFTGLLLLNSSLESLTLLGNLNGVTIAIFLCSGLFPISAIWAAVWFYKNKNSRTKKIVRALYFLSIFCGIFLSFYCIYHGWFAKMMWS